MLGVRGGQLNFVTLHDTFFWGNHVRGPLPMPPLIPPWPWAWVWSWLAFGVPYDCRPGKNRPIRLIAHSKTGLFSASF